MCPHGVLVKVPKPESTEYRCMKCGTKFKAPEEIITQPKEST